MPNLLTHYRLVKRLFSEEVDGKINPPPSFLDGNFDALALGAQGPDPLFFYPLSGHFVVALRAYGSVLHDSDGKKLFRLLLKASYAIDDPRELARFRSFVLGQFAHYLLDRECHPFVFYQSGFDREGRITGKYHFRHTFLESQIDVVMARKFHMDYFLEHPEDVLSQDPFVLSAICKNFAGTLSQYFEGRSIPRGIYGTSVKKMRAAVRFANRHPDFNRTFFRWSSLGGLSMPRKVEEDVLNERHLPWRDPVDGSERSESFLNLFNQAYDQLREVYHLLLERGYNYEVFQSFLNGRDYDGKILGTTMRYKKPEE